MTLCTFENIYGTPPENCRALQAWLWELIQQLIAVDTIRCGSGAADPTGNDLEDLWGTCDVPPGGFVIWYNTVSLETLYFVCPEGSVLGCGWTELTLS